MSRTIATIAAALAIGTSIPAHAVGRLVDVQVVDRGTGETLAPVLHRGEWWVAGRPGAKYGVTLISRQPRRTLSVISVDGVNAISGDGASWDQTGYVLGAYENARIDGWRKDSDRIAAFEFTALPDSYAARTGRPANVGVIGIAIFHEKRDPVAVARPRAQVADEAPLPVPAPTAEPRASDREANASSGAPSPRSAAKASSPVEALRAERIGTGHGEIEASSIRYVGFRRAQATPDEVVTIRYDRLENLVAMGIVPAHPPIVHGPSPDAFPASRHFVADPPPR